MEAELGFKHRSDLTIFERGKLTWAEVGRTGWRGV